MLKYDQVSSAPVCRLFALCTLSPFMDIIAAQMNIALDAMMPQCDQMTTPVLGSSGKSPVTPLVKVAIRRPHIDQIAKRLILKAVLL